MSIHLARSISSKYLTSAYPPEGFPADARGSIPVCRVLRRTCRSTFKKKNLCVFLDIFFEFCIVFIGFLKKKNSFFALVKHPAWRSTDVLSESEKHSSCTHGEAHLCFTKTERTFVLHSEEAQLYFPKKVKIWSMCFRFFFCFLFPGFHLFRCSDFCFSFVYLKKKSFRPISIWSSF